MDRLFLRYIGSTKGIELVSVVDTSSLYSTVIKSDVDLSTNYNQTVAVTGGKGNPLLTADILTASWKCGGMKHLAGYEQRDAHEFLHGFLETLGKHMRQFRDRVSTTINSIQPPKALPSDVKRSDGMSEKYLTL
jgi:hypothetical protein